MYSGSQVVPVIDPTRCCTDRWPMGKSSMKMMGSRMAVELDSGGGQVLNSRALENEEDGQRCRQTFQFTHVMTMNAINKNRHISSWMLIACGVWLIGLGLYFIALRPPLLPEDPRFMGTTIEQIRTAVPGLEGWLKKVFSVMGGFMAGAGVLTIYLATIGMPLRLKGTSWTIAIAGVLTVVLMSVTNFMLHSDFRWVLLVPALVWLVSLITHIAGR